MHLLISCSQLQLAKRLQQALQGLDIHCSQAQVLSNEVVGHAIDELPDETQTILFFCSDSLSACDQSLLEQICDRQRSCIRVVVVGQSFSAGAILSAMRSGAVDCIQVTGSFDSDLRSLMDRLHRVSGVQKRQGRLVSVIGGSGGAGASLIALNLAALFANKTSKCSLLDLHWRGGDLATLLNVSPKHTLLSLSSKIDQLDRAMFEQTIVNHESGIRLLASPEPYSDCRQMRGELIQKVVHIARAEYPSVVVDLENCDHEDQVRTLATCDRIVVPMRPDVVSLVKTQKFIKHLTASGVNLGNLSIVINRAGQKKELPEDLIRTTLQVSNTHSLPDDPIAVNESINVGVPFVIGRPKSKITECLKRLSDSLWDSQRASPRPAEASVGKAANAIMTQTIRSVSRALGAVGVNALGAARAEEASQYA